MDSQVDGRAKLVTRLKKILAVLVGIIILYTILGFLLAPPILKSVLSKKLTEALNRTATIETIRFNPYVLSLSIRGFLIENSEKSGAFISFDHYCPNVIKEKI